MTLLQEKDTTMPSLACTDILYFLCYKVNRVLQDVVVLVKNYVCCASYCSHGDVKVCGLPAPLNNICMAAQLE